jgi:hypothetical protein
VPEDGQNEGGEVLQLRPAQPVHGTRGDAPGPRGCWALKHSGEACGAARRADSDFCNAHSGVGVASDPASFVPLAHAASAANRERRATLRAALGITRTNSPRALLKAQVFVERERIAAAAIAPALDPNVPTLARGRHALSLLEAVDPTLKLSAQVDMPTSAEEVEALGLTELRALVGSTSQEPPEP